MMTDGDKASDTCPGCGAKRQDSGHHQKIRYACGSLAMPGQPLVESLTCLRRQLAVLRAAAKKLRLCFPDEIPLGKDEKGFTIPGYILNELDAALGEAKP